MKTLTRLLLSIPLAAALLLSCEKEPVETAPQTISFQIDFGQVDSEASEDTLKVTVTPSSAEDGAMYCYRFMKKEDFVSEDVHVNSDFYNFNKEARRRGVSLEEVLKDSLHTGTSSAEYTVVRKTREYILYVYQVFPDNTTGKFFTYDYTWPDPDPSAFRLSLDVQDIKSVTFRLITEPSDKSRYYYIDVVPASQVDSYPDINAYVNWYVKTFSAFMPYVVKKGSLDFEYTANNIYPDTDYVFFGFAINTENMKPQSDIFTKRFRTAQTQSPADFTATFKTELAQLQAVISVATSDEGINYYMDCLPAQEYQSAGDEAFRSQFEARLAELKEANPTLEEDKLIKSMLRRGSRDVTRYDLEPDRDYIVWLVACDETGQFLSGISKDEFQSLPFTYSPDPECYVKLSDAVYFWGDDLDAITPSPFFKDRIVCVHERQEMGNGARYWTTIALRGDHTDAQELEDWEIISIFNMSNPRPSLRDKYNKMPLIYYIALKGEESVDITYATFCIDDNGYYSPVTREFVHHDKDGCSPTDDWYAKYNSQQTDKAYAL